MALSARQQYILKLIVGDYTSTGVPIGSKSVVEKHNIGVSSATVRNEMAVLEEQGYLTHPHTSAGRIPTEAGYRYFVEKLMEETRLSPTEQLMIQHQFYQARLELDQWMRLSAAVLAHSTQNASLVTSPKISRCKLKHIELVSIHEQVILLILVLQEGAVKQQILNIETPHTQEELRSISRQLTDLWAGRSVKSITATGSTLIGLGKQVVTVVTDTMGRVNARQTSDMYHDGLLHMLQESDLVEGETLEQVIRVLEEQQLVDQLVGQALTQKGVQIIIAGEDKWNDLSQVSIVISSYGAADGATGALGVVGPTRMPYSRAVSIVRYMSQLMSNLMIDLYGNN